MNKHIAIKCTYNNGGEGDFVGFLGTCTEELIKENVKNHVWCSQPECLCKQYFENGFVGEKPDFHCLESKLFKDWSFGAGTYVSGKFSGRPRKANLQSGGICLLTTRFPGEKEVDRKIIGLFKIGSVTNEENEETKFFADEENRIRLPLEEAKQLFFWDYYSINSDEPLWGSGLFRYMNDSHIKKLLLDLIENLQSNHQKEIVKKLLLDFANIQPFGKGLRNTADLRKKRIIGKRKYGPGGEGDNHKRLKEWISNNPQAIGLTNVVYAEMEYPYISGDAVDILFKLGDGTEAIVEIETTIPEPGSYQAIKYRALRCAEKSLSLDSEKVKAFLIAWEIPSNIRKFCEKYNIKWYEIKK